jgi:acyl carrier protein
MERGAGLGMTESVEEKVTRLVLEYAQKLPAKRPLDPALSLRGDLAIDSLSLVSVTLRLGEELGIDLVEKGADLASLRTLGDLAKLGHALAREGRT